MDKIEILQMLELERLTQPKHELGQKTKKAIEAAMTLIRSNNKHITIDVNTFEMILNCMANQKFMESFKLEDREEAQKTIDHYWNEGMKILHKADK